VPENPQGSEHPPAVDKGHNLPLLSNLPCGNSDEKVAREIRQITITNFLFRRVVIGVSAKDYRSDLSILATAVEISGSFFLKDAIFRTE
jgi:hypothetical protein